MLRRAVNITTFFLTLAAFGIVLAAGLRMRGYMP
jgi:hypothetical protein